MRDRYELEKRQRELAVNEALAKIGLTELPAADYDPVNVPTVQRAKLQAENAAARFEQDGSGESGRCHGIVCRLVAAQP